MNSFINDPIEVLIHFKSGRIIPLRFLWQNRTYKINSLTTAYQTKNGGIQKLHFAALSRGNLYELVYTPHDHLWKLLQTSTLTD